MNIAFSKYQLQPASTLNGKPRDGALLRIFHENGQYGYCDCHPWHELGDAPLQQQLDLLAAGKLTSLTAQSLAFAKIDAQARKEKRNLFQNLSFPDNHYHVSSGHLLTDALLEKLPGDGIRLIKVKTGNNFQEDCALLNRIAPKLRENHLKLRLDFNCKLDQQQFEEFLIQCSKQLDVVDFFEDPFLYSPDAWRTIRQKYGVRLACDRDSLKAISFQDSCDYLVVKPAIQDITPFLSEKTKSRCLVLTSYLDHPIGQISSLYAAAILLKSHSNQISECGFLSNHAYQTTPFSQKFNLEGSRLIPSTEGTGFGYDNLLNELKWIPLK